MERGCSFGRTVKTHLAAYRFAYYAIITVLLAIWGKMEGRRSRTRPASHTAARAREARARPDTPEAADSADYPHIYDRDRRGQAPLHMPQHTLPRQPEFRRAVHSLSGRPKRF